MPAQPYINFSAQEDLSLWLQKRGSTKVCTPVAVNHSTLLSLFTDLVNAVHLQTL